jgi:general secretion pathway protein G
MSEPKKKSLGAKIITTVIASLFAGFVIVIVIPNFIRARYETSANACINNLRQIDAAKNEWALENEKTNGAIVTENDIKPYIKLDSNGNLPKCPAGGTYTIGRVGEDPKCSIGTSAWPNDHVLNETNNWWTDFKMAYGKLFGLNHSELAK